MLVRKNVIVINCYELPPCHLNLSSINDYTFTWTITFTYLVLSASNTFTRTCCINLQFISAVHTILSFSRQTILACRLYRIFKYNRQQGREKGLFIGNVPVLKTVISSFTIKQYLLVLARLGNSKLKALHWSF